MVNKVHEHEAHVSPHADSFGAHAIGLIVAGDPDPDPRLCAIISRQVGGWEWHCKHCDRRSGGHHVDGHAWRYFLDHEAVCAKVSPSRETPPPHTTRASGGAGAPGDVETECNDSPAMFVRAVDRVGSEGAPNAKPPGVML